MSFWGIPGSFRSNKIDHSKYESESKLIHQQERKRKRCLLVLLVACIVILAVPVGITFGLCFGRQYCFPDLETPQTNSTCETTANATPDNGWILLFQKVDNCTYFNRSWDEYVEGFGECSRNFWMGLEKIHNLTNDRNYSLKMEISLENGTLLSAEYGQFRLRDQRNGYAILAGGYQGVDGDFLNLGDWSSFNGMRFSTYDRKNHVCGRYDCGSWCGMGWWYRHCHWATPDLHVPHQDGAWYRVFGGRMMMKPSR